MDSAGIEQIKFGASDMIDYGGVTFVRQDDPQPAPTKKSELGTGGHIPQLLTPKRKFLTGITRVPWT